MEQQYQTQLNTTAQSIVALFAANNKTQAVGTSTPVSNELVNILSVDPSFNVNQAFQKAATNQKPLTNVDTKALVSTAVSNIIKLLKTKYSAEQIQGMEQKIIAALAAGKPNTMQDNEYKTLIKQGLASSASFGHNVQSQGTKPRHKAKQS